MGSEQSSQGRRQSKLVKGSDQHGVLRRGKTIAGSTATAADLEETNRPISPEASVCSDSDLPYISYTVNRPIGDSPKLPTKQISGLQRGKSLGSSCGNSPTRRRSALRRANVGKPSHDIVVVKPGKEPDSQDKDPHLLKLQSIPMFLPIMRGTLNLPGMRDPEVLEKLDPQDILGLCKKVQSYMALCADHVATSQTQIANRIRDIDFDLCRLVSSLGERQKKVSKAAEKLSKVSELSHQLNRCHTHLNSTLELIEHLNNNLPQDSRLEPFVWTTG